jgi:hypothetical protein
VAAQRRDDFYQDRDGDAAGAQRSHESQSMEDSDTLCRAFAQSSQSVEDQVEPELEAGLLVVGVVLARVFE